MPLAKEQLETLQRTIENRCAALADELRGDAARLREETYGELTGPVSDTAGKARNGRVRHVPGLRYRDPIQASVGAARRAALHRLPAPAREDLRGTRALASRSVALKLNPVRQGSLKKFSTG